MDVKTLLNNLSERLKQYRDRQDLSQQAMAEKMGMSQPTYFRLESGDKSKRIDPENLQQALKLLGLELELVVAGEREKTELSHAVKPVELQYLPPYLRTYLLDPENAREIQRMFHEYEQRKLGPEE